MARRMIHISIGTKAQYIKMSPIMHQLDKLNIPYNLIDLGQHSLITKGLREEFCTKKPDVILSDGRNISTLLEGIEWMFKIFRNANDAKLIREHIFRNESGFCLIHGDTASTLLALLLAKRAGLKVVHIEAGLRSYHLFQPFPEELIRIFVMRYSNVLFAPSIWALSNLKKMGLESKSILLPANTSLESTQYSIDNHFENGRLNYNKPFALITTHRIENIFSKKRMILLVEIIEKICKKLNVLFVQHPATIMQLKKYSLIDRLKKASPDIKFYSILSHSHFIHLLSKSNFVVSDGGSIQEECFYLNKPCLLFRSNTERQEGLNENIVLSSFSRSKIQHFLDNYHLYVRKSHIDKSVLPSEIIVKYLLNSSE